MAPSMFSAGNGLIGSCTACQPFFQCTPKAATSMVTISGMETQRTANPISSSTAPPTSALVDSQAMSVGKGRPSPQSGLPNQRMMSSMLESLLVPATQNTGTRYRRSASGPRKSTAFVASSRFCRRFSNPIMRLSFRSVRGSVPADTEDDIQAPHLLERVAGARDHRLRLRVADLRGDGLGEFPARAAGLVVAREL